MKFKNEKRPTITSIKNNANTKSAELFQNDTLRPIIKMQHQILVLHFHSYLDRKKIDLNSLTHAKQMAVIDHIFLKDQVFKAELRGIVLGHFSASEYTTYELVKNESNKRINAMIAERLKSTL